MARESNAASVVETDGRKLLTDRYVMPTGNRIGSLLDDLMDGDIKPEWILEDQQEIDEVKNAVATIQKFAALCDEYGFYF